MSGERGSMAGLADRSKSCLTGLLKFSKSITECGQKGTRYTIYLDFQKVFVKIMGQRLLKTLRCQKVRAFVKLAKQGTKQVNEIRFEMISTELKSGVWLRGLQG